MKRIITCFLILSITFMPFISIKSYAASNDDLVDSIVRTVTEDSKRSEYMEKMNDDSVYIKQSERGKCTLASCAMVMRRAAILSDYDNWDSITEEALCPIAWLDGTGVKWEFSYKGYTMGHAYVSTRDDLKTLLEEHPEGIVAYDQWLPHAILLTEYDEEADIFYGADPSQAAPYGRIDSNDSLISVDNVRAVWYITNINEVSPFSV